MPPPPLLFAKKRDFANRSHSFTENKRLNASENPIHHPKNIREKPKKPIFRPKSQLRTQSQPYFPPIPPLDYCCAAPPLVEWDFSRSVAELQAIQSHAIQYPTGS
jgi:hypothetical protein